MRGKVRPSNFGEEEGAMLVEFVELVSEKLWPARWEDYQRARYDYEGYIERGKVSSWASAEMWAPCRGKRVRPVEVVLVEGRRLRVYDAPGKADS